MISVPGLSLILSIAGQQIWASEFSVAKGKYQIQWPLRSCLVLRLCYSIINDQYEEQSPSITASTLRSLATGQSECPGYRNSVPPPPENIISRMNGWLNDQWAVFHSLWTGSNPLQCSQWGIFQIQYCLILWADVWEIFGCISNICFF